MKKLVYIAIGLIICAVLLNITDQRKRAKGEDSKARREAIQNEKPRLAATVKPAAAPNQKSVDESAKVAALTQLQSEAPSASPRVEKQTSPPKVLEITFNEEVVTELEKNWSDLRNQIQVTGEARGFRVNYLADNSLFLNAGLQTGDLIPYETLNTMRNANPEAKQLAGRVIRIFEHVR